MEWSALHTWIVIVGSLCAMACAMPGALLVLRRMSMMGDAISHTVLPGLAIAFLVTHSRSPLAMFTGAAVIGVLTAVLIQTVHRYGKTDTGAAMGIVFTTLFALGVVLMRQAIDHVHIDADCVLYGAIENSYPFDNLLILGAELPRAAVINGGMFMVNLILICVFYKEFKISSFDPALATTLGINAQVMHYLLMIMTAATAVAAFETVGSILVIAMLIVPGATAYLLTDRFGVMLILSVVIGVLSAIGGHVAAITVPSWFGYTSASTSGMMALMSGVIFTIVWITAPRHGVASKMLGRLSLSLNIACEDVLGMLYRLEELDRNQRTSLPGHHIREAIMTRSLTLSLAFSRLVRSGQLTRSEAGYELTSAGRDRARNIVRSHRLWETWLAKYLNLPADHVHMPAERLEHITDEQMQRQLEEGIDQTSQDPHGKSIPPPVPPASHA